MIYELAYHLHMPVYILREQMPYDELVNWQLYFEKRPVGWRDDDRFMRVLNALGSKDDGTRTFASLARMKAAANDFVPEADGQVATSSLKNSAIFSLMLSAKSGDKVPALLGAPQLTEQTIDV